MAYRDDGEVARLQLAELERQIATRAESRPLLRRYRRALRREVARLEHACLWYDNGQRRGFNKLLGLDDLSPTDPPSLVPVDAHAAPPAPALLDAATAMDRVGALMRRLDSDPLQASIARLRDRTEALRSQLALYVDANPLAPPPPPAFLQSPLSVGLVIVGVTGAGLLATIVLTVAWWSMFR